MRAVRLLLALIAVASLSSNSSATSAVSPARLLGYQYLSPVPGSRMVSPSNNVVFRLGDLIDRATLSNAVVSVTGSTSGAHSGRLVLSDDGKSIVFSPDLPYATGESVLASLAGDVRTSLGAGVPPVAFSFSVTPRTPAQVAWPNEWPLATPDGQRLAQPAASPASAASIASADAATSVCDQPLPGGYLPSTVVASNAPGTEAVFVSPFNLIGTGPAQLLILDETGVPLFQRKFIGQTLAHDFKVQPNGLLTFWMDPANKFYAMDSTYTIVDSFAVGNRYATDVHDLQLIHDGHALIIGLEIIPVDMSVVVPGGDPNAEVGGAVIQELDADKNVIFQWRSFDHYQITDCVSPGAPLTTALIDYVHANAIELDNDGNLLLSARHMDEITKIDRATGDIIWRLGANAVNNEFTFIGDSRAFSHQHDIRRLPNGDITLFDNGNYDVPEVSRGVEYRLDETAKTATMVWEYHHSPEIFGGFMGDVQRHDDGRTTMGWGGSFPFGWVTDFRGDGTTDLEINLPLGYYSYRAFRFPWHTTRFSVDADSLDFGDIGYLASKFVPVMVRNTSTKTVTINCVVVTGHQFAVDGPIPATLEPGSTVTVNVQFSPGAPGDYTGRLYVRQVSDTELVAQVVRLHGECITPLAVGDTPALEFGLGQPEPNPTHGTTRIAYTLTRAGAVSLAVYDVHGRRVQTLVQAERPAGRHELSWRPAGLPSGLYFCSLRAGDRSAMTKIVLTN